MPLSPERRDVRRVSPLFRVHPPWGVCASYVCLTKGSALQFCNSHGHNCRSFEHELPLALASGSRVNPHPALAEFQIKGEAPVNSAKADFLLITDPLAEASGK